MLNRCVHGLPLSVPLAVQLSRKTITRVTSIRMASTIPDLAIFRAIAGHDPQSTAVIHSKSNRRFTYGELLRDVEDAKGKLFAQLKSASAENGSRGGQRVAFLVENGYDYVGALSKIMTVRQRLLTSASNTTFNLCMRQHCCSIILWIPSKRTEVHNRQQ